MEVSYFNISLWPGSVFPSNYGYMNLDLDFEKAFVDLEKACDTIDRHGMWQMLRVHGVGGKLLKAVLSFHVDSRTCVLVGMNMSDFHVILN